MWESMFPWLPETRENVVSLNADHMGVCKFDSGQTDQHNFQIVRCNIKNLYEKACSRTPLFFAAKNGHEAIVKLLLDTGKVDINSEDNSNQTPLSWAAREGHKTVVKLLLNTGKVDIDSKDNDSQTPLLWAAKNGHEAIVKLLLDTGKVDINSKDNDSQTPLLWAAKEGHEAIVQLLLNNGADIESRNSSGQTSLFRATERGRNAVGQLLLNKGADINSEDNGSQTPLSWATRKGHKAVVQLLLKNSADIKSRSSSGQTPLSLAASNGHEVVVQLLLKYGADIESRSSSGQTPLLLAAINGHEAVVQLLLKHGADIESRSSRGQTPLSLAASNGHEAVVQLLLRHSANIESRRSRGQTPLSWAARKGHKAVVQLLLKHGADVESRSSSGQTPLSFAAGNGHEDVVKLLLATDSVEPDSKDNNTRTPIWYAIKNGHDSVAKLLSMHNLASPHSQIEEWMFGDEHPATSDCGTTSSMASRDYGESTWSSQKRGYARSIQSTAPTEHTDLPRLTHSELVSTQKLMAQILAEDDELLPLFRIAVGEDKIGGDRLERNFKRLLGIYSKDLVNDAQDKLCRDAAIFVGIHAEYISKTIHRRLYILSNFVPPQGYSKGDPAMEAWEKDVNDYLGRLQDPFGQGIEDGLFAVEDGDVPDEFELRTDTRGETFDRLREENIINHPEQVKQFLRGGDPWKNLRSSLRDFVMPYPAKGSEDVDKKSDDLATLSEDPDNGVCTTHPGADAAYLDPTNSSLHLSYRYPIRAIPTHFAIFFWLLKFADSVGVWYSVITAAVVFASKTVSVMLRVAAIAVSDCAQLLRGLNASEINISPGCSRVLWKCVSDSFASTPLSQI